jgi:transcriptional regulator with XRE-family HTH domain
METASALAAFLRARREVLKPADVGLPDSERRRVEGLRREEVAMLAGISTEYYLKLEQGRDHQPSDQVLEGLARALQLDDDAASYLRELARPAPHRHRRSVPEKFDPTVQTLIDSWPLTPAFVINRNMRILASNGVARVLSRFFAPGQNILRAAFLEPELRMLHRDWDKLTTRIVPLPEQCSERSLPIANSSSSSVNSASRASVSPRCGRVTTSNTEAPVRPRSTIHKSDH